ncbi:uncharacterized protein [Primulina eburnea]|uniref:uncharacterized protein n=1 Tax=Primulina eburnea TaxID=1245227 RepID=UPI003C6C35AC
MEIQWKRFQSFQPPILQGIETPVDCENWLEDMEMLFEFLDFTDDCRVKLIGHQLQDAARSWWLVTKEALEQRSSLITWKIFKIEFCQRFFPVSYRQDKSAEFSTLRQGHLSIDEYLAQFFILLRFVPHVARNDEAISDQFIRGLNPEIRTLVNVKWPINFADTLNRAKRAETVLMGQKGISYDLPAPSSQQLPARVEIGSNSGEKKAQLKIRKKQFKKLESEPSGSSSSSIAVKLCYLTEFEERNFENVECLNGVKFRMVYGGIYRGEISLS